MQMETLIFRTDTGVSFAHHQQLVGAAKHPAAAMQVRKQREATHPHFWERSAIYSGHCRTNIRASYIDKTTRK